MTWVTSVYVFICFLVLYKSVMMTGKNPEQKLNGPG